MAQAKKIVVSLFILLNFFIMARVHFPLDKTFFAKVYRPIDSYLSFFSIYQDWLMFAPNPGRLNVFVTAKVEFDDGTMDVFTFPRSSELNIVEKYIYGEKYRKFISEGLRKDDHSFMWEDAAKFALRKLRESNFHKVPLRVHLTRHWDEIPDLNKEFRPHGHKSKKYESYKFYTYEVI